MPTKSMWPLQPASLTAKVLAPFKPLNYGVLARAFESGLIDLDNLREGFGEPDFAVSPPPEMLRTFLETSPEIDRSRDIAGELQRLSHLDDPDRPSLWIVLGRLIVDHYPPDEAQLRFQELFQEFGTPDDMRPFSLYGNTDLSSEGESIASFVEKLRSFLKERHA
jgi:hypothetical protein